ncbi:MAG: putative oxidoreductase [Acidobacteria bacterium]|nr:putative oxidoreductase [Acidobacteriota bacterium]
MSSESLQLAGRVAVITGASRGIGRAVAERLAQLGAHVVINYVRDEVAANEVVSLARGMGVEAISVKADVSTLGGAHDLVAQTLARFKRLDLLICNAGIWEGGAVENISEEMWDRTMAINLKGTWTVCREAIPQMKEQRFGRIVVVSSTAGQRGEAHYSNYAASKGGQISFTKALSTELGPYGITVNAVAPGWVDTELSGDALANAASRRSIESAIPIGRVASADDIAWPIIFLCSEWARHITGEVLNVNGGSVLCG